MNFDGFWILRNGYYAQVKDGQGTIYSKEGKKIYQSNWNYKGCNVVNHNYDLMKKLTNVSPEYPEWAITSQEQ